MSHKKKYENLDFLFQALLELQSVDDCYGFFAALCTGQELHTMAKRFQVAKMLTENRVYNEIVEETGASTATISRVKRSLADDGETYDMVFRRLKEKEEAKA